MEIYVSINGVLRNLIQKFDYHYKDYYFNREAEEGQIDIDSEEVEENKEPFEYGIEGEVQNDNLLDYYKFQSLEEYENFMFFEYPVEIFAHAGVSYPTAISDLNKLIYENKDLKITLVGIDEFGKAKPSTLFFLAKNGSLVNNIKFIKSEELEDTWKNCDVWVTDSKKIIDLTPKGKKAIKFKTNFNNYFTNPLEIDKLENIENILKNE